MKGEKYREKGRQSAVFFQRKSFEKLVDLSIRTDDKIDWIYHDFAQVSRTGNVRSIVKRAYEDLVRGYCNEYVYKNSLLRWLLRKHKKDNDIKIYSEFKVADRYADIAVFNGESAVYEIKTALDNPDRLGEQIENYKKFFQKIYIVTSEKLAEKYEKNFPDVGVAYFTNNFRNLITRRESLSFQRLDLRTLMRTLHTVEYKNLVRRLCNELPNVGSSKMYSECYEKLKTIPQNSLRQESINLIKTRPFNLQVIRDCAKDAYPLVQMCLSIRVNRNEYSTLSEILKLSVNK